VDTSTTGLLGVNTLRTFGDVIKVWGARARSDGEWRYLNVRRLFAYIEESIAKGARWVVFEPNSEALWLRLRRSVIDFLSHPATGRAGRCQGRGGVFRSL
jgi:phage tail sheath protein FI